MNDGVLARRPALRRWVHRVAAAVTLSSVLVALLSYSFLLKIIGCEEGCEQGYDPVKFVDEQFYVAVVASVLSVCALGVRFSGFKVASLLTAGAAVATWAVWSTLLSW